MKLESLFTVAAVGIAGLLVWQAMKPKGKPAGAAPAAETPRVEILTTDNWDESLLPSLGVVSPTQNRVTFLRDLLP